MIQPEEKILVLKGVEKSFGETRAVQDLSFSVRAGSMYGLLGPNGAGKTTTIRMIMRILLPDTGAILFNGRKLDRDSLSSIGYLPEERGLYQKMRVEDQLVFFAKLKGVSGSEVRNRIRYWVDVLEMTGWANNKTEELSKGMQQKVQLVISMIHNPSLVILDEPFSGLDPANVELVKEVILKMRREGVTFLLSTHMMEHVEELCDHVCLIHQGREILGGPIEEVRSDYGHRVVKVGINDGDRDLFAKLEGVLDVRDRAGYFELVIGDNADPVGILRTLSGSARISRFEIRPPSIRDVFLEVTK